ncbi:hypothetical protein C0992_006641, partial [Termitomyces sp. T32_za158]
TDHGISITVHMSSAKIRQLKSYLRALPPDLELVNPKDTEAKVNRLLDFGLDEEWIQDVGEEGAVNREIEVALQKFLPRNDSGIFFITQRGKGVEALADVLEYWVDKLPDSIVLQSWLQSSIDSARKCIQSHGQEVCSSLYSIRRLQNLDGQLPTVLEASTKTKETMPHQTTLDGSTHYREQLQKTKVYKKPETKVLNSQEDPNYIDTDESDDERKGGRKIFPLLKKITRPCHAVNDQTKKIVRCVASKGCRTSWGWPRDKTRILKHAMSCGYLANIAGGAELVQDAIEELARKQPSSTTLKRSKTEPVIHNLAKSETSGKLTVQHTTRKSDSLGQYCTEGKKILEEKANSALVELIVCCGIAPRIIQHQKFHNFVNVLNQNYVPPSRTKFEDSLVPSYAAATQVTVIDYLKSCRDLMLSFDGGKLGKKKFFSIHVIAQLRELLAFMSLSTYTLDCFDMAREDLHIPRGLQSIGETRFGSIYWSLDSVLQGIPAFKRIVRDRELGIESEMLHRLFDDDEDVFIFQRDLKRLGTILMPVAHAIQCLEAKETNPADVYTYWLAIVAHFQDLFTKDDMAKDKSKYSNHLKEMIRAIINCRFSELIENKRASNIYLTAFVLDPDNRAAPIINNPNPLAIPSITITREKGKPTQVKAKAEMIDGIGISLLRLLQKEYGNEYREGRSVEEAKTAMQEINPYLSNHNPREAIAALKNQFRAYLAGIDPFNRKRGHNESLREYWFRLVHDEESDVLA